MIVSSRPHRSPRPVALHQAIAKRDNAACSPWVSQSRLLAEIACSAAHERLPAGDGVSAPLAGRLSALASEGRTIGRVADASGPRQSSLALGSVPGLEFDDVNDRGRTAGMTARLDPNTGFRQGKPVTLADRLAARASARPLRLCRTDCATVRRIDTVSGLAPSRVPEVLAATKATCVERRFHARAKQLSVQRRTHVGPEGRRPRRTERERRAHVARV